MPKDLKNGARSFKSQAIGSDSFALTVNFKWLLQVIAFILGIAYTLYQYQMKIQTMEMELAEHKEYLEELMAIHEAEENERILFLEESVKWYEKEMVEVGGFSLNPLSWKKRNKNKD